MKNFASFFKKTLMAFLFLSRRANKFFWRFSRTLFFQEKVLESRSAEREILCGTKNQEGRENYPGDDFPVGNPIKGFPEANERRLFAY